MPMSDEDIWGDAPAAAGAPAALSDDAIWGKATPQAAQPGYTDTFGRTLKRYADDAGQSVSAPFKKDSGPGPELLQRIGDMGGRAASIVSDAAGAVTSPVEAGFSSGLGYLMPEMAKKYAGRDLTPEEAEKIQKIADDTGQLMTMAVLAPTAAGKTGAPKIDPTKPVDRAISDVAPNLKKMISDETSGGDPSGVIDMLKNDASGAPGVAPTEKIVSKPFDPADVHKSITDEYGKALQQSRAYYKDVRDIGGLLDVPVKDLRKNLDQVIGEINDDPLHEGKSAVSDLKRIRDKIGDDSPSSILDQSGKPIPRQLPDLVTANDLLDIKQFLNENFNSKRFAERADNPYTSLSKVVKSGLADVGDMHPPFADAMKTADKFWVNGVDLPYRGNDVLHKFWNPEDYHAQQSIDRGIAEKLPDATRQRQYSMLKRINNPIEFEALKNALPPDAQKSFAEALSKYIKEDVGYGASNRIKKFAKGAFHMTPVPKLFKPRTALQEMGEAFEPNFSPEQEDIMKSIAGKPYASGGAVTVNKEPTPAQKAAGNYKKHHIRFHGLDISIENPKGSTRSGEGRNGKKWSSTMPDHYGYIKRTQGADGDHVDVYVGDNDRSNRVYVIDQKDPETGVFDEHKCMLGYADRDKAVAAYRSAFSDKKERMMKVTRLSIPEFKGWLKSGNTKKPFKKIL